MFMNLRTCHTKTNSLCSPDVYANVVYVDELHLSQINSLFNGVYGLCVEEFKGQFRDFMFHTSHLFLLLNEGTEIGNEKTVFYIYPNGKCDVFTNLQNYLSYKTVS